MQHDFTPKGMTSDKPAKPTFHLARLTPDGRLAPVQGSKGAETIEDLTRDMRDMRGGNQLVVVQVVSLLDVRTTVVRQDLKPETLVKGKSQEKK